MMTKMMKPTEKITNSVKNLTEKETEVLKEVLALFEVGVYKNTGVKHISGGFANADMFAYDDEIVDIEVTWGVQSDCTDTSHTEEWKLKRKLLSSKKPISKIVESIHQ